MTTKAFIIREVRRFPEHGPEDTLTLQPGVNVIVGRPNTGKTKWLQMLDYLMGEDDKPENTFGQELAEKYDRITALVEIDGTPVTLERRWKERGLRGKVLIDGEQIAADDFSQVLLRRLEIPVLHYPKGNPYSPRAWSELSWRQLLRHIYRQQRFWSDLADKQYEGDQLACLMLFLGIAENLYSHESSQSVELSKQLNKLEGAKEQFETLLHQLATDLVAEAELQVAITRDSLDTATHRYTQRIGDLQQQRLALLESLRGASTPPEAATPPRSAAPVVDLGDRWAHLHAARDALLNQLTLSRNRLQELENYRSAIKNELARLERAQVASRILSPLKVSHCPVCSQTIAGVHPEPEDCYLCGQHWPAPSAAGDDTPIEFEQEQLRTELEEANQLILTLTTEQRERGTSLRQIEQELAEVEGELQLVRQAVAAILPPELTALDVEIGRLQERIEQLKRLETTLDYQDTLTRQIDTLRSELAHLQAEAKRRTQAIQYEHAGDVLAAGMNTYLNQLTVGDLQLWSQGPVAVRIKENTFTITIGGEEWSRPLGGTLRLYFLMAYHYALLNLSHQPGYHYPGLVILDLPPTLEDQTTVLDKENYVLQPFVELTQHADKQPSQVIAAGSAFEGLHGAHMIQLTQVWRK